MGDAPLMTGHAPDLTLFIGPPSRHGLALNLATRSNRAALGRAGVAAYPTRIASPALRAASAPRRTLDHRRAEFDRLAGASASFLAALGFLSPATVGFRDAELFPRIGGQLSALAETLGDRACRIVIAPAALPDLFTATGSEPLEAQVRATPWEVLYELNWTDLVIQIRRELPKADVFALTHIGVALGGKELSEVLFGSGADAVGPQVFLHGCLNATGQAVLDRMPEADPPGPNVMRDLYLSFADRVDRASCCTRLGIDRLTHRLLMQRFDEDIARIAAMDGVRVI